MAIELFKFIEGEKIYSVEYEVRGMGYRAAVVSADEHHLVTPGVDKSLRECLHVFHAKTGARLHRYDVTGLKVIVFLFESLKTNRQIT